MTNGFDAEKLGRDFAEAGQERTNLLDAVQDCQAHAVLGMGCGRLIDQYDIADERYKGAAQAINMYRAMLAAQANARTAAAPICR